MGAGIAFPRPQAGVMLIGWGAGGRAGRRGRAQEGSLRVRTWPGLGFERRGRGFSEVPCEEGPQVNL